MNVCAVSYLNTQPYLAGINAVMSENEVSLRTEIPSVCAEVFKRGEADVALIPAGALPDLEQANLLDGYCIGAGEKVDSVYLFSNVPVQSVNTVYLDFHSRTSNGLARVLSRNYWQIRPEFVSVEEHVGLIGGTAAGVVIGDRAVLLKDRFRYCYDLAAEWHAWTGQPFVFAVWVYDATRADAAFLQKFRNALERGLALRDETAAARAEQYGVSVEKARYYLRHCIDYRLDAAKREALARYLRALAELEAKTPPRLRFMENA